MRRLALTLLVVAAIGLTGCASSTPTAATESPTATAKPSPTKSPTPSASPTPKPVKVRQIGFTCTFKVQANTWDTPSYKKSDFDSPQEVWASPTLPEWCEMRYVTTGAIATIEKEAAKAANLELNQLDILWEMCADLDHLYATNGTLNAAQQAEANGVLMLCPDHPGAAIMANGSIEQQERNAGLRFGAGVREVNSQVQPGLYRATGEIENCYWERMDSAGRTIDNNFILAATQVEVTIEPTDFSFNSSSCGEWVKVG